MQDKKVFISYASENRTDSMVLCYLLEQRNIPCWIAPRDILPGENYGKAIMNAITQVDTVIILLTEFSNKSKYVAREIERSVSNDKLIIPVVIETVTLSKNLEFFLSDIQWELVNEVAWENMISKLPSIESPGNVNNLQEPAEIAEIVDEIAALVIGESTSKNSAPAVTQQPTTRKPEPPDRKKNKMRLPVAVIIAAIGALVIFGPKLFTQSEQNASSKQQGAPQQASLVPFSTADLSKALEHVLDLNKKGETKKAEELIADLSKDHADDRLVRAVATYLDTNRQQVSKDNLSKLSAMLEKRKVALDAQKNDDAIPDARPRVLACIGPVSKQGGDGDSMAMLYRICIQSELESAEGIQVVEREAIETVFEEMNLGSSNLADTESRLELGKLLPAGILMLGDIIKSSDKDLIYLRLVDTETTRVISTIKGSAAKDDDIGKICAQLAQQVREKILAVYPLQTSGTAEGKNMIKTPIGRYHGASSSTKFNVYTDITANELLGQAHIKKLGDVESTLEMTKSLPERISEVFLCEQVMN